MNNIFCLQLLSIESSSPPEVQIDQNVPSANNDMGFESATALWVQTAKLHAIKCKRDATNRKEHHRLRRRRQRQQAFSGAFKMSLVDPSPLPGFPSPPAHHSVASNLHMYEPPSDQEEANSSSASDAVSLEVARRSSDREESRLRPFPPNPLDFEYFDKVSRN